MTDEQAARTEVNRIRKKCGMRALGKLKRGIRRHSHSCTIAMSLAGTGVGGVDHIGAWNKGYTYIIHWQDPAMSRFMDDFDDGKYPHLEMPKSVPMIKRPGERKQRPI